MSQVNLHNHTEGSFLDGLARVADVMARAKECGHEYVTITDHGECNQHLHGAKAAAKAGLGFIPGIEGYWALDIEHAKTFKTLNAAPVSHIVLLAANNTGLRNMWALSSIAYDRKHHWYKPIADPELMRTYAEGIYASDGCMLTEFADLVDRGDEDRARQILGTLLDIYRERFYIELHTWQYMDDSVPEHMALNAKMRRLNHAKYRFAQELSVPFVIVNDSHHAYPEQWVNKELVWAFNTSNSYDKLEARLGGMAQKADHIMSDPELDYWMGKHGFPTSVTEEGVRNAYAIAQSCQVQFTKTLGVPRMHTTDADDLGALIDACEEGFRRHVTGEGLDEERYYARLEDELGLIAAKNFAGYFNMVRDYTSAYRNGGWSQYVTPGAEKVPVLLGPGRGSVGGSLVAYLTGIDIIDPIKYGTLFTRFLSPGRKGLPDIDLDVPQSQRKSMLGYFPKRFGADNVCAIGTLSRNGPKATLRDVSRAMNTLEPDKQIPRADIDAITEHIADVERMKDPTNPDDAELTWEELIDRKGGELKRWKYKHPKLFEKLEEMSGLARHSGVHAAGILVSSVPLLGAVPMRTRKHNTKDEVVTTQLDMNEVEELGGVKNDLLGIRHLDTLSHARRLIYERHGVWVDYDCTGLSVPAGCGLVCPLGDEQLTDPAIWPQIDAGQTLGIFQMETSNGTEAAVEFRPRSERDVADLSSIVRPGVADAGLKDVYLRRRAGSEPVLYDHPLMEAIVGPKWSTDTYGILVYQEQIIECVQQLASFTADEADDLRKFLGKKLMDKIQALKGKFIVGCQNNYEFALGCGDPGNQTMNEAKEVRVANKIWDSIEASGRYAFNWSHAVGYALISTWEVWTKHYYPQEFLVALMATDGANVNRYLREARRRDITILPPDINASDRKFTIDGDAIRYGLDTVDQVGPKGCTDILAARPYTSLDDFLARAHRGAEKATVYNLICIGAFDEWYVGKENVGTRFAMGGRGDLLEKLQYHRMTEDLASSTKANPEKLAKIVAQRQASGKYHIPIPDFADPAVMYQIEKELVGTHVTVDPMARYLDTLEANAIRDPADMLSVPFGDCFIVGGQVADIRPTVTKKGRNPGQAMAHISVSWNEADFRVVCFPEAWATYKAMIQIGAPVACRVKKLDSGCCLEEVRRLDILFDREGIA